MKSAAIRALRRKLADGECTYGLWVTLESASVTEIAVALGLDWVVIDAEHGPLDWNDIAQHVRAAVRSDTVALVRLAELNIGLVKRALDIGADGVVIPWVETPAQAVAFATYPPRGLRGIGAERATGWGACIAESVAEADEHVLVVPIIESLAGGRNIEALCRVPGIDFFWIGPADYSSTAGYPGQWEGPGVAEELLHIKETIRKAGKHCGVVATGVGNIAERREQGFSLISLGADAGLVPRSLRESLASVGISRQIAASLMPKPGPLSERPAAFAPDRPVVMNFPDDAEEVQIAPGVVFRPLVGARNGARGLTTGIVTLAPGAELPRHTHTFTEVVTVLEGRISFEVEGRQYALEGLDNITAPPGFAHALVNTSQKEATTLHIAMATTSPTREFVARAAATMEMPASSTGHLGGERVSRHATADWYEPNPGARFRDFCNRDINGTTICGGYGLFAPGAQLPCHIHDFDESICIIQGEATCVVEGERHPLSGNATALVPRGRCHYFINETDAPMAMVWYYAGPMPESIVLASNLCDNAG